MLKKSIVAAIVIVPMLSACAVIPSKTNLNYVPPKTATEIPQAKNVSVSVVVENHKKHKWIGHKKDGFGISMADIYPKEPVSETVKNAFEKELVAKGFSVNASGPVGLHVVVKEFHSHFDVGMFEGEAVANLDMDVAVINKDGKTIYTKDIVSKGKTGAFLSSGSNAGVAMDRALGAGLKTLFDDPKFIKAMFAANQQS